MNLGLETGELTGLLAILVLVSHRNLILLLSASLSSLVKVLLLTNHRSAWPSHVTISQPITAHLTSVGALALLLLLLLLRLLLSEAAFRLRLFRWTEVVRKVSLNKLALVSIS